MTENVENLILEHLRAMRTDITALRSEMGEVKQRLSHVETILVRIVRDDADAL